MALNSSNFQILVNAVLDAKNIQAQLDKISQKYATMKVGIDVDTSKLNSALSGLKGLKVGFEDTSTSAEKTSQSIGDIFAKVSKFGGVTLVINELRQSLMEGVDAVRELDAAVTEYKKVSDLTDEGMKSFVSTAREMGLEVGKSATEFIEAGTQFKKMGYSDQESLQLGKVATMFQNIADTAISAGDSASFVNSQMKAFNMTAEDAQHIIDVTNEVANNMAVGTNDLAKGLTVAGAGLSVLGNDFEQSIALITSGTEILTGRSVQVARGLTTIGNNIAKAANEAGELSFKVQGVTKSIDLFDKSTGEMKSTYQVFQDLKSSWDDMSQAEKQSLGLALAGKNQFSVFNSVMLNLNSATEAYKIALDSQGSALKENARYLDSIQGKVSQFTSELEKFWTEGISSDSVKRLVEFGTQVLKLINDLGGMPTVLTAITGAFITLNGHKVPEMIAKISTNVLDMIAKFDYAYAATGSLAQGFTAMAGAGSLLTASLGAVSLVVTGLVAAYGYYNTQQENARRAAEQAGSSFEDERKNLYNLRLEYINAKDAASNEDEDKQKLKSTISKLAKAYGVEEEALSNLNGTRAEGLDLLSKENAEKSQDFLNRNQAEIQKAQKATQDMLNRTSFYIPLKFTSDTESSESFKAFYNKYTKSLGEGVYEVAGGYKELIADLNTTITAMQQEDNQTKLHQQTLAFLSNTLVELEDKYNKTATLTREAADATVDVDKKTQSFINTQYDSLSSFESVYNALLKNNSQIPLFKEALDEVVATQFPDFAKALGIELQDNGDKAKEAADGVNQYGEDAGEAASQTEEFEKAIKSLTSELKGVQDAYDTLHEVADEYNKTGSVTIDTMADLLSLNPAYLESLQMVNGQLVVNDEFLMSMAQSLTESEISAIYSSQGLDTFSESEQKVGTNAETGKQGSDNLGTSIQQVGTASSQANPYLTTIGNTAITTGNQFAQGAQGILQFASSLDAVSGAAPKARTGSSGVGVQFYSEGFDAQVQAYRNQQNQKLLEELRKGLQFKPSTSGGKSGKGGGGSKKSSTSDAEKQAKADAKAYKEAFEKELATLDKQKASMKDNAATDKWYYEQLEELTNKYYKDKEGYEDEYNKYHEKALDGMTKAHDAAYTERYNLLKHQLAMDMISEQEYYDELEELMKEFYSNEEKYAEQRWKIEEEIYSGRNKLEEENTRKAEQEAEKRKKARKEEWEEEKAWYEEQQSNLETAFSYVASLAQKEIDALNERKQAIQDQYDAEIDKINEKNDATNDEIELQEKLDALAKAQQKKVRIYREGQGFVYETDQSAVDEAKTALTQYKKEQDTKKEIKRLEDIRDATINSVEEQIKYWQKYKDEWGNVTDNYTTEQNKLLAEQVLGISLEGENWEKRLGNLQDYVDRYNEIMSTLKTRYKSYDDDDDEDFGDELDPDEYYSDKEPSYSHGSGGDNWYEDDTSHGPGAYANGTTKGYGLSMVGEKGRELRVLGSRSNEGDGIIPNHLTENLMQLGKFSPTQWLNSIVGKMGGQSAPIYNYAFENLTLPNVTNAQSFIDELKNLKNRALQMGGRRD